jgi:glycine/D-amino acid oxidase-like deaminating enzyme
MAHEHGASCNEQTIGETMRVLICGGGVIGASIAYFLSCRGVEATVIERTGLACAASGKSGGFLALDWCDGTPLEPLARRSFALHARLAEEMSGDWSYRRLTTHGGSTSHQKGFHHRDNDHGIGWLSAVVTVHQRLGSTKTTAQVHPGKFTQAIMKAAQARGAELRIGRVTGVVQQGKTGRVEGVLVDGEEIDGDAVVIAMGPWSILAVEWLPLPAVFGLKGHSLVFDTGARLSADALFVEYREATGAVQSPEVFPRSDGTTYVCAISSDSPLPIDPAAVAPDPGAIERLLRMCHELSPALASAKVLARQACYRPITRDGLPLIGRVPGVEGAYVAAGHSVWGILNAPATGEAMAELIVDGAARTLDLSPFNPGRIPALDPTRLRRNR